MTLTRKTPLKAKTPLRRAKPNAQCNAQNAQKGRRKVHKAAQKAPARFRSPTYLAWVRQRPCCFCGQPGGDAHHVIGLGWGLSGMGLTAPDSFVMPLCRHHHDMTHRSPVMQAQQPTWLRWTITAAITEFGGEIHEALREALAFINEKEQAA